MIKVTLTNEILQRILEIDENRFSLSTIELPPVTKNRLKKNSKKKSSYASNKIEGNPPVRVSWKEKYSIMYRNRMWKTG